MHLYGTVQRGDDPLTHTLTHTRKKADGNNGDKGTKDLILLGRKVPKSLISQYFEASQSLGKDEVSSSNLDSSSSSETPLAAPLPACAESCVGGGVSSTFERTLFVGLHLERDGRTVWKVTGRSTSARMAFSRQRTSPKGLVLCLAAPQLLLSSQTLRWPAFGDGNPASMVTSRARENAALQST